MKTNHFLNNKKNALLILLPLLFVICVAGAIAGGVAMGLHMHNSKVDAINEGKKSVGKFLCFGLDNWEETYQFNCYNPKPPQPFKMSSSLSCTSTTTHGLVTDNSSNPSKYLENIVSKTDYVKFKISIDEKAKSLYRSDTGGDVAKGKFDIVRNDESAVVAIRKAPINPGYEYEQFTILKQSGKGSRTWYHSVDASADGITSDLIQCM